MPQGLDPGTMIGQRFFIEAAAGSGGMGTVYRGHDIRSGEKVAIKLLHNTVAGAGEAERFAREVEILAELRHPAIVSYVAHGFTDTGQPYLVMEWLEGEDLSRRLRRGPLSPHESLVVMERVAEALEVAHQRHIVHRDLKPSNLFLRHGDIEQVTLLDFGIARRATPSQAMTRTGVIIGSPEYMAPEQARGQRDIGASADIFSLGCVLYECLSGRSPFAAEIVAGVVAKILFEPAPALRSRRPSIPESLDQLVSRMLEKEPANRLQDASDLLEAMANLEVDIDLQAASGDTPVARSRTSFPPSEQQLVSVLLSSVPALVGACDSDTGEASSSDTEPVKDLERALSVFGADVQILADGSVVAMLTQRSHMAATDLAAQAARCALALVQCFPTSLSTLTTGRAMLDGRLPIGEVVERSVLMRELIMRPEHAAAQASGEVIYLDDVTAGLLDARFETRRLRAGVVALRGERTSIDETRSLLGRPTQTVGRDRELAVLDLLYSECRDDSNARVVLITAPAGMGKSRLRHEFVRRLESRHEPVRLLMGRGDPLTMASPYGLLAQAVRQLCGIAAGDDALLQRKKLWQYVHSRMPAAEVKRVGEFVGELCGISTSDEDSEALLSARQDLRLMSLEIFRAFGDLLAAECRVSPVLLVLEDLHWSDTPSVRLVDAALRDLNESRLMVLGLARPEIEKVFPRLWADRRCQDLRLESLNRKACERLVLRALNQQAPTAVVNRIIEQSAGNPLFLEELIRAVAEGKGDEMPETVLAMLQSRVMRLEPGARRVLRVASIFGQTFWRGGLIALLRAEPGSLDVELWLQRLVELEILELQRESRFPQEVQYRFRHGLFRDAAYSLLTAEHRRLGHRMAAEYLDHIGETDFFVLVEHLERAEPPREPLGPQAD